MIKDLWNLCMKTTKINEKNTTTNKPPTNQYKQVVFIKIKVKEPYFYKQNFFCLFLRFPGMNFKVFLSFSNLIFSLSNQPSLTLQRALLAEKTWSKVCHIFLNGLNSRGGQSDRPLKCNCFWNRLIPEFNVDAYYSKSTKDQTCT